MRSIGVLLIVMGIGSFVLHALNMEFTLLQWVDEWGVSTGNMIRVGAAALGILLVFLSSRKKTDDSGTTTKP